MKASGIDPGEFRDAQETWGEAATGWKKWSGWLDEHASPISERLVELAGVEPGSQVLDVAAGYGEPTPSRTSIAGVAALCGCSGRTARCAMAHRTRRTSNEAGDSAVSTPAEAD